MTGPAQSQERPERGRPRPERVWEAAKAAEKELSSCLFLTTFQVGVFGVEKGKFGVPTRGDVSGVDATSKFVAHSGVDLGPISR